MARSMAENDNMTYGEGGGGGGGLSKAELMAKFKQLKEKGGLTKPLQKAIETVLEVGWGNVEWPSNFTAMHLAAKVGTVESIELLVAAGAEITIADDWRLTPLDYAAQANRTEIITCLQSHLSNQQKGGGFGGGQGGGTGRRPPSEPDAERRKLLVVPDGLRPELQRACEAVIKKGWSKIKWPHDFTALHLAGRLGSTDAATLLIKASAWPGLELKDDKGLTPLDYAKEKNHEPLVKWFQEFQAEHGLGQGGGGGGGTGPGGGTGGPGGGTGGSGGGGGLGVPGGGSGGTGRAGGRSGILPGGVDIGGLDLAQERLKAMERDPEELGLNELRQELTRLRTEKDNWLKEKNNLIVSGIKPGAAPPTDIPATGGPLDEEAMIRYLKELQAFGREAVAMKLMETEAGGGLNLDQQDAIRALAQLDFVCKIAANASLVTAAGGTGGPGGGGGGGGGDGTGDGQGKGKGKKGGPPSKGGEPPKAEEGGGKKGKKGGPPGKGDAGGKKGGPPGKGPGKGPPGPGAKKGEKGAAGGKAGGKGGADAGLSKPKITPKTPMKPLWWTRMIMGQGIKEGETIWDEVTDDHDLLDITQLETRFSKNATAPKEKPKKEGEGEKKEEVKLLRIITDPNVVVGKEASLKQLPPAQEVAKALEELDESEDTGLSLDWIRIVRDNACPNPAQMKELVEARKAQPNVPLALPEQYMWVIGNMPAYQQRLDCWEFVRTYAERQETYCRNLQQFEAIVQCFTESDFLPSILGIVLAVGNYLNGGTNRGQADGFDIETLNKLEAVKDAQGKDIRHYIFDVYFNTQNDKAAMLIDELAPMFGNIARRLSKDSDGTEKLNKSARIVMEDFDQCVGELHKEFTERHETMQMILQYFEDPADPFKLRMPNEFAVAKDCIDDLVQLKDHAKDKYSKLLNWFKIAGMKSSEFCLLWDNLFIPPDMIVNKGEKIKKEVLIPTFCQPKPLNVDDLMILWEFKDPSERRSAPRVGAKKGEKKARGERRKTRARAEPKAEEGEAKAGGADAPEAAAPKGKGAPPGGKGKGKGKAAPPTDASAEAPAPAPETAPAKGLPVGKGKKGKGAPAPTPSATEEAPAPAETPAPAPAGKGKKGKAAPPPTQSTEAPAPAEAEAPAASTGKGPPGKGPPKGKGKKK